MLVMCATAVSAVQEWTFIARSHGWHSRGTRRHIYYPWRLELGKQAGHLDHQVMARNSLARCSMTLMQSSQNSSWVMSRPRASWTACSQVIWPDK